MSIWAQARSSTLAKRSSSSELNDVDIYALQFQSHQYLSHFLMTSANGSSSHGESVRKRTFKAALLWIAIEFCLLLGFNAHRALSTTATPRCRNFLGKLPLVNPPTDHPPVQQPR